METISYVDFVAFYEAVDKHLNIISAKFPFIVHKSLDKDRDHQFFLNNTNYNRYNDYKLHK